MRNAPPVVRRGEVLLAGELLARGHVPQAELDLEPPVALARHAPGDEALRIDGLPVGETRQRIEARDLLDVGRRIDRVEQAGAAQVIGDDLRDAARGFGVAGRPADEVRDGDRDRLDIALRDVEPQLGGRRTRQQRARRGRCTKRKHAPAREAERRQIFRHSVFRSQLGRPR